MPVIAPEIAEDFVSLFNQVARAVNLECIKKGFWDDGANRNVGEMIALMHSELSEGLEAMRHDAMSDHIEGFYGIEEELADCIIRIMDFAAGRDLRVASALVAKLEFNASRPHKHGKLF